MMDIFSRVNLAELPPPQVVEVLDVERILDGMLEDLKRRDPGFSDIMVSDPAYRILEVCAYRELLIRQRINEAARSTMVAHATGSDLDNLAANYGIARLQLRAGRDDTVPPKPAEFELDEDLRTRIVLSLEARTTAGSRGSYVFHALSASGEVRDAAVTSLKPGTVNVAILSRIGRGTPSSELLQKVVSALNGEQVRPLCDTVEVQAARIIDYAVDATLTVAEGAGQEEVVAAARAAVQQLTEESRQLGHDLSRSALVAALHQSGVHNVVLSTPDRDMEVAWNEAMFCTGIVLRTEVVRG